ncbi:hypothetical protein B7R21_17430 [Subtercola boreus]|uniref:ABC transporter permease n=1 Tax=Subtercola boreus TaxID=120213 RepID=A0A3E0VDQ5_9MICO|nr:ABC transporter permease [Subtercola boreus]RFA07007.1 hypothetical protein B7R21_17430 [Subtercola boreus]
MTREVRVYWRLRTYIAWALAISAFLVFAVSDSKFLNAGNLYALVQSFAVIGIVSIGLMLVMVAGEFDLSVAGTVPLAGLVAVRVSEASTVFVGVLAAVVVCGAVGFINGFVTARFALPSLAVTVGTLVLTTGLGFAIAGGQIVTLSDYEAGIALDSPIAELFSFRSLLQIILIAVVGLLFAKTWIGLGIRAVGSDPNRAATAGISIMRTMLTVFIVSGLFAGIAGAMQGVSLAAGVPGDDQAILLQAVTAAIIGGTALSGGRGSTLGVVAGALLLTIVSNGLSLQGTSTAVIQLLNGGILVLVVLVNQPLQTASKRLLDRTILKGKPATV